MVKKGGLLILIVFISIILASIYGFLHNQISYSNSTEYFTKFKFEQFWSVKYMLDFPRMSAGLIGIASSWWGGLLIGLTTGIVGLLQPTSKSMWKSTLGAIIRTLGITIAIGIVGILIGQFVTPNLNAHWNLPYDLTDPDSFLTAGTMHNFSYIGCVIGLIYGLIYQLRIRKFNADKAQ